MRTPDRASSAVALASANASCTCLLSRRTSLPRRTIPITATGTTANITRVSCQAITKMITTPPISMIVLDSRDSSVSVTAFWMVVTSLPNLERSSPMRVLLKKRSGIACRWP